MSSFGLEELDRQECERLLAGAWFGRVAVFTGEQPAVLPVLYGLLDGQVVFRTAAGDKLVAAVLGREVVFEIDHVDPATKTGWSVNVVGRAEHVVHPAELARAEALGLEAWAGEFRDQYVRIRTQRVSGRRVTAA